MRWVDRLRTARRKRAEARSEKDAARKAKEEERQQEEAVKRAKDHEMQVDHLHLLDKASGIGVLHLVLHMETWIQISQMANGQQGWSYPLPRENITALEDEGMVDVALPGIRLAGLMDGAWIAQKGGRYRVWSSLARRVYWDLAPVVSAVEGGAGGPLPTVYLDDRTPSDEKENEDE